MGRRDWRSQGEGTLSEIRRPKDEELEELVIGIAAIQDPDVLRRYSQEVIEEISKPSNVGPILDADGHGIADGLCGDTMTMYVQLDGDIVERCTFTTDGCGPTIACGSRLTKMVSGMKVGDAMRVSPDEVSGALGGLPEDHEHCAALAVLALRNALRDSGAAGRGGRK